MGYDKEDRRLIMVIDGGSACSTWNGKPPLPLFDIIVYGYERDLTREEVVEAAALEDAQVLNITQYRGIDQYGRVLRDRLPPAKEFAYEPEVKSTRKPTVDIKYPDSHVSRGGWSMVDVNIEDHPFPAWLRVTDIRALRLTTPKPGKVNPCIKDCEDNFIKRHHVDEVVTWIDGNSYVGSPPGYSSYVMCINGMYMLSIVENKFNDDISALNNNPEVEF